MSEKKPTTEMVRYDYAIYVDWLRPQRAAAFDEWLNSVKAEAWDEGRVYEAVQAIEGWNGSASDNPYRRTDV